MKKTIKSIATAALGILGALGFVGLFAEASTTAAQLAVWAASGFTLYLAYIGLNKLGTFNS